AGGSSGGTRTGRYAGGPSSGMTDKEGFTVLTYKMGDKTADVVVKGDKVSVKSGDEWLTADELKDNSGGAGGGRGDPAQLLARRARQFKRPAAAAQELADRVKGWSKEGD